MSYYCKSCDEKHLTSDDIDWEARRKECDTNGHVKNCVTEDWCTYCARKLGE